MRNDWREQKRKAYYSGGILIPPLYCRQGKPIERGHASHNGGSCAIDSVCTPTYPQTSPLRDEPPQRHTNWSPLHYDFAQKACCCSPRPALPPLPHLHYTKLASSTSPFLGQPCHSFSPSLMPLYCRFAIPISPHIAPFVYAVRQRTSSPYPLLPAFQIVAMHTVSALSSPQRHGLRLTPRQSLHHRIPQLPLSPPQQLHHHQPPHAISSVSHSPPSCTQSQTYGARLSTETPLL